MTENDSLIYGKAISRVCVCVFGGVGVRVRKHPKEREGKEEDGKEGLCTKGGKDGDDMRKDDMKQKWRRRRRPDEEWTDLI